jgi:hypothetical protein
MKKQVVTPLIKEINEKLSEISPENQQQILAFMNYLIEEEKNRKANDYPPSSEIDLTTCMTE